MVLPTGDGNTVSLVVQVEGQNDKFVVAINNDIALVTWNGVSSKPSSVETIKTLEGNEEKTRINDGKVDPAGRLWAGNYTLQLKIFMFCYLLTYLYTITY